MNTNEGLSTSMSFDSSLDGNKHNVAGFHSLGMFRQHSVAENLFSDVPINYQDEAEFPFEVLGKSKGFNYDRSQVFREEKSPERSEEVLQQWEGIVEMVDENDKIFTAQLYDLTTDEPYASEVAELLIDDVSDDDQNLLQVGAVFYLTVGYSVRVSGQKARFVRVEFRRLPNWTESDLNRVRERAQRITRFLDSES